jgi:hypothetical protein
MQKYLSLLIGAAFVYAAVTIQNISILGMVLLCLFGCIFVAFGLIAIITWIVDKIFENEP